MTVHYHLVREALDNRLPHVRVDKNLVRALLAIKGAFITKSAMYVDFFGGVLTGDKPIRFTPSDASRYYDYVFQTSETDLEHAVRSVKIHDKQGKLVPSIDPEFNIAGKPFNIACVWLIHKIQKSDLSPADKLQARSAVMFYLLCSFLTSIMRNSFPHPVDKEIAEAAYASLSNKFMLKKLGSWSATVEYNVEAMVGDGAKALAQIEDLEDDYDIVLFLNAAHGRIKSLVVNIAREFYDTHKEGKRIRVQSSFVENADGEQDLREYTRSIMQNTQYLKRILPDNSSFVAQDLVTLTKSMVSTITEQSVYEVLWWTSKNYEPGNEVDKCVDLVLEYANEYLGSYRTDVSKNLSDVLVLLRGTFTSAKNTNPRLLDARRRIEALMVKAVGPRSNNAISALRTVWMLYVVLRAYTMKHFANR